MNRPGALLLASLLLLSTAAAAPIGAKDLRAPWVLALPDEANVGANGTGAVLTPLGDADGDGYDDLLVGQNGNDDFHAVAGPGLDRIIWSLESPFGAAPVGDLNDDGVSDVLGDIDFSWNGDYVPVGTNGVYGHVDDSEFRFDLSFHDGATSEPLVTVSDRWQSTEVGAWTFQGAGPAYAYASVDVEQDSYTSDVLTGPDQKWIVNQDFTGVDAYAFGPLVGEGMWVSQPGDLTFTRTDFADNEKFSLTFDDEQRIVDAGDFVDVTGDGVADLLVVTLPRPVDTPVGPVSYGADKLEVFDGSDGSPLWSITGEEGVRAMAETWYFFEPMGDLDGDGNPDVGVIEVTWGSTIDITARILSGADGSELLDMDQAEGVLTYGDIDGDGSDEFLVVSYKQGGYTLELRSLEETYWSLDVSEYSSPMNLNGSYSGYRFTDVTGDGAPDLLLWDWDADLWEEERAGAIFTLYDGTDASEVWTREMGPVLNAGLADVTGDGLEDIVVLTGLDENGTQVGYWEGTNHTMRLDVLSGTDGRSVWGRVILDPEIAAGQALYEMDGYVRGAGDIDGDGSEDLIVNAWNGCDFWMWFDGSETTIETDDCEIYEQHLVLSGRDASVLLMLPELNTTSGKDALPEVEAGEAFQGVVADNEESPMPLLLVVAALWIALRRR